MSQTQIRIFTAILVWSQSQMFGSRFDSKERWTVRKSMSGDSLYSRTRIVRWYKSRAICIALWFRKSSEFQRKLLWALYVNQSQVQFSARKAESGKNDYCLPTDLVDKCKIFAYAQQRGDQLLKDDCELMPWLRSLLGQCVGRHSLLLFSYMTWTPSKHRPWIAGLIHLSYFKGMKRDEWVAPIPGRPCLTGLLPMI